MRVPGLPAAGGDRLRPRRQQRRDLLQLAGQGAGGDVRPLGGQRRHDPVHRPAQHVLLMQQPGQEPRGEQPLRDHLGRRRRAGRLRPVARAAAPVAAAPQQNPDQRDPPVDQLAVLGADEFVPGPAARAAPLLRFQVDDAFLGLQVRVTAPAVPRRARTLPPSARTMRPSARAVLAAAARGRSALFAGGAEQQPAQRRDRLLQPAHLGGQRGHPGVQLRVLLPQLRCRRLGLPSPGAPVADLSILIDHRRDRHVTQHTPLQQPRHAPNPACRDPRRASPTGSPITYVFAALLRSAARSGGNDCHALKSGEDINVCPSQRRRRSTPKTPRVCPPRSACSGSITVCFPRPDRRASSGSRWSARSPWCGAISVSPTARSSQA